MCPHTYQFRMSSHRVFELYTLASTLHVTLCYSARSYFPPLLFGTTAPIPPPPLHWGRGPPHSQGFWITHNDAPQSVVLLWTNDQPVAEAYT
jgi:hypothetical protein